jgi:hypothetical protein
MENSVKRISKLFALSTVAVLASQACNSSPPGSAQKTGAASTDAVVKVVPPSGALQLIMNPAAQVGTAFEVDVAIRNSSGALLDVADVVTLKLATNPVAGVLGGTLSKAAVHGVASFTNLTLSKAGTGYAVSAASSGISAKTVAITSAAIKVAYSEDDAKTNTSPASAQAISPNVPIFGTLGAGEVHYFKFVANASQLAAVLSYANRLDQANWDTGLRTRILAPDGVTELARGGSISPNAPSIDSAVGTVLPATGTYYLAVDQDQNGLSSGKFGVLLAIPSASSNITLQVEAEPAGTTGKNDTAATAQALSSGVLAGHYDSGTGGVATSDYYKVTAAANTRVHLELISARAGQAWDGTLTLSDAAGNVLSNSDNAFFLDPAIDYVVTTAGTYYVRVGSAAYAGNSSAGSYFLYYAPSAYTAAAKAAAASNTVTTATPFAYNQDITGTFTAAGTQYFSFPGTAGDVVRLSVLDKSQLQSATLLVNPATTSNTVDAWGNTTGTIGSPGSPNGYLVAAPVLVPPGSSAAPAAPTAAAVGTLDAFLLSTDGATRLAQGIASNTATEIKLNTRQTILQLTGKHYIKVTSSAAGKFGLRLDNVASTAREVEPNNTAATGTAIGTSGWSSGVISSSTDQDHFKIPAQAGQLMSVSLLAAAGSGQGTSYGDLGSALVPVVEIRDPAGNLVSSVSADRKGQTNFAETAMHPEAMVEASFRAGAAGTYDVTVSDADSQGGAAYFYALHVWANQ